MAAAEWARQLTIRRPPLKKAGPLPGRQIHGSHVREVGTMTLPLMGCCVLFLSRFLGIYKSPYKYHVVLLDLPFGVLAGKDMALRFSFSSLFLLRT